MIAYDDALCYVKYAICSIYKSTRFCVAHFDLRLEVHPRLVGLEGAVPIPKHIDIEDCHILYLPDPNVGQPILLPGRILPIVQLDVLPKPGITLARSKVEFPQGGCLVEVDQVVLKGHVVEVEGVEVVLEDLQRGGRGAR